MTKKFIFCLIVLVFSISFVIAASTPLIVKTVPNHKVHISVLKTGEAYSLIESFHKDSGSSGEVKVTLSTEDKFNIRIWVKQNNIDVVSDSYYNEFKAGEPITLELYPDWYTPPKNETEEQNTTSNETEEQNATINVTISGSETNNETNKSSWITGNVTAKVKDFFLNKTFYYILGAIIILVAGFYGFMFVKRNLKNKRESKSSKTTDYLGGEKDITNAKKRIIQDAERKLFDVKKDLERLK